MANLQVRNVPEDLHRVLKEKAAGEGSSLSDFVLAELEKIARRPTPRELRQRLRQREPVHLNPTAAQAIRELREHGYNHADPGRVPARARRDRRL